MRRLRFEVGLLLAGLLAVSLASAGGVAAAEPAAPGPADPSRAIVVSGTGTIAAQGAGFVRLSGSYVLSGSMRGGSLKVSGVDPGTIVRVGGWTSKTGLRDGSILFRGVTGRFLIAGRTIVTTISSRALRFVASGHGRAVLIGHGTVSVHGRGPIRWPAIGRAVAF